METMFPAVRRSLPPVPRRATEPSGAPRVPVRDDDGQDFVTRLRSAAADFAAAAGAVTAVVREAVPPARHRRSRCRVVLRYPDGAEVDLAFVGPAGRPDDGAGAGFSSQIQDWLRDGQRRAAAWMVADADAAGGEAVDVTAWLRRG